MNVLIVKTSSMGDLIHTLPAVTDAANAIENIAFDWVAEEGFAAIPGWHPAVERVIPIALRRWRKGGKGVRQEISAAITQLRKNRYDAVIDAQGLIKSAIVTRLTRGRRCGMTWGSCRESLASLAYQQRYPIATDQHAIDRLRQLFAAVLDYPFNPDQLDYGLDQTAFAQPDFKRPYLVFLHAASWPGKLWPISSWIELAQRAGQAGFQAALPWGSDKEQQQAAIIAEAATNATVLPRLGLTEVATLLAHADGVVGVDTGLAHLSAAFSRPTVTLYLTTNPALTGTRGERQCLLGGTALQSHARPSRRSKTATTRPNISVDEVWDALNRMMTPSEVG